MMIGCALLSGAMANMKDGMNGYTGGNMNGKYSVWSGTPNAEWNDDYASKGYEYFDVWAPEIASYYGQVFWTDQGNLPLPQHIQERFKGKVMAIQGYEQDQVMVTPVGKPGVNPDKDVSVPINWAYNHHYMAWMTGAHSEMRTVPYDETHDYYADGAHGQKDVLKAFDLPSASLRADPSIPTNQMFSEGNGGESRKSFHGYPQGYAQLIDSPTSWHITPMQIDTRNRDCGVTPESVSNCTQFTPGPEPRQARYGRGIPPEGTNYSGILECPCNGGYGGSPQFYADHPAAGNNTKHIEHKYSAIDSGSCSATGHIGDASICFGSVLSIGINATSFTNKTVSDPSQPNGCSVTVLADGSAVATFNTAGTAECANSTTKVGASKTVIGTSMSIEYKNSGKASMTRQPKGEYCSQNKVGILGSFETSPSTATDQTILNVALSKCEAFCASSTECNACSVDLVAPGNCRFVAIPACGPVSSWTGATVGDVSLKTSSGNVTITLSGPADGWFGFGLDAVVMSDSPYTLLVNSTNVWEQKIGTCGSEAEHCPGDELANSITVLSNSVTDNVRTVVVSRSSFGKTPKHYTFDMQSPTINYISAIGSSQAFGYHKAHIDGVITLASPPGVATCVCDVGNAGELCSNGGTGCNNFVKRCVPAPAGSLLEQNNPTCNSRQYVGGLSCCHHGRIMLDEDQNPGTGALLRYHMKFRFWFQEYVPANATNPTPSHYNLPRIYYQTEANAGEYDIPPAFSIPGNPVAGYSNWPLGKMTPGTSCTGTCPDGPDCECIHTIEYHWTMSNTRIVYAGGHCHAPACISIELYENSTGTPNLICRQLPVYGSGDVVNDKYDEAGYLALPPCLFSAQDKGLQPGFWIPENTPMFSIKKNRNTKMGHYGEMASWQMRGVNFPEPKKSLSMTSEM